MQDDKLRRKETNSSIFLIWWYWPLYYVLIYSVFPSQSIVLIRYIILIMLFIYSLKNNKWKLNIEFIMFVTCYILIMLFNTMIVSYRYEVLIESLTSLLAFITPIYLLSNKNFSLINFIDKSFKWAIFNTIFTLLAIYLTMTDTLSGWSYGNVSSITVPNIIILIYGLLVNNYYDKKKIFVSLAINITTLIIFGSRMPTLALPIVFLVLILVSFDKRPILKTSIIAILLLLFLGLFMYYKQILSLLIITLDNYGINSRALNIIARDIGTKSIIDMMRSSGREDVWPLALEFIKLRVGLPGGFGVVRNLTHGKINYSHNLFLDLCIFFGITIIPIITIAIVKIKKMKYHFLKREMLFFIACFTFFIVTSLTGAFFLEDRYAIVSWGIIFFYKGGLVYEKQ